MAKAAKEAVHLVSTAGTGFVYTLRRNKKKGKGGTRKLALVKYDPIAMAHVEFTEKKLSRLKKKFSLESFNAQKQDDSGNTSQSA